MIRTLVCSGQDFDQKVLNSDSVMCTTLGSRTLGFINLHFYSSNLFSHDTVYLFTRTRILFDCPTIEANKRPGKVYDSDSGQFKFLGKTIKIKLFFFIFNTSITLEKILKLFSNLNFQGFWTNINLFEFPYRANRPTLKDNSGQPLYVESVRWVLSSPPRFPLPLNQTHIHTFILSTII